MKVVLVILSVGLIVAGVLMSVFGFLMIADAEHHLEFWSLGEDLGKWEDKKEDGLNVELIGICTAFGGFALLLVVAGRIARGST
jgi:hypothetical protein